MRAQNCSWASTKWLSLCQRVSSPSNATTSMPLPSPLVLTGRLESRRGGSGTVAAGPRDRLPGGGGFATVGGMTEAVIDDADAGFATDVCERVLALVGDRAEAVVTATVGTASLTRFANSRIHQNLTEAVASVGLTVALGSREARATTSRTDDDALAGLVARALDAAAVRPDDPDFAGFAPPSPVPAVDHWDGGTAAATPDQRAAVVAEFVAAAPDLEAAGFCSTTATTHALVATTGQRALGRSSQAQVDGIFRVLAAGDHPADGYAQATSVRLGDLDGAAVGARAAAKARSGRDPVELPPGRYEVVLEPRAVAAAMTYPAVVGFPGKAHAEGRSFVR